MTEAGPEAEKAADFAAVHAREKALLAEAGVRGGPRIGLAFSGGGIRSATFNLGILQGMARRGLLKHVDYLSTVSGGGYIGAWYMAFLRRQADNRPEEAERLLDPECQRPPGQSREHPAITWLRRFSNYLTPRTGLSGDTLTLVSTYLRNLILNLIVIVSFLGVLLLLPRAVAWSAPFIWDMDWLPLLATLPLVLAVLALPIQLFSLTRPRPPGVKAPAWQGQGGVLLLVLTPALASAFFLTLGLASPSYQPWAAGLSLLLVDNIPLLFALELDDSLLVTQFLAMAVYLAPWLIVGLATLWDPRPMQPGTTRVLTLSALGASVPAGLMFFGLARVANTANPTPFELVTLGPPLVMLAFMLPVALHIGLARRRFNDMQREWWARLGGWMLILALAWLLIFGIALFGPPLLDWLNDWVAASGGVAWLAATVWGVLAGKDSRSGQDPTHGTRETLLGLVPWVFLVGLLGLLSWALQAGLAAPVPATPGMPPDWRGDIAAGHGALTHDVVLQAGLLLLALFLLFGWRVDINLFSFHNFYRNRLTRCYLGASRHCPEPAAPGQDCRAPNPFSGFDPEDDLPVSDLGPRPYPLFNTALNLVGGDELAWQQRKAAAFCIAPRHCGFEFPPGMEDGAEQRDGYGDTATFLTGEFKDGGGVRLGTAMAISGAAVNPNMGFHSSPAVSFLLTVFNARLGRWVGNPRNSGAWAKASPSFGVRYLFYELFGLTSAHRSWFNLSDGGHFENLGLYELVRRRLPYIIASDAAEDAGYHFDDLANAIRKIRADLGVDIEIDVSGLRPAAGGYQRAHAAIGHIRYDRLDPRVRPGVLIYLRPGFTGNEPADVLSYARRHPPFPFQSTTDQFFDEAQFESYRQLGQHIAQTVFQEAAERQSTTAGAFNPEAFFTVLKETWRGRLATDDAQVAIHHNHLDALFERLRTEPDLAFMSAEIFPEWPALMNQPARELALPASERQRQSGFYLCREIAQFMERVYLDLDLDNQYDHPDSRGWMNLFRHWSWSPMFRATYAISAATLSESFQRFCRRRLDLGLGETAIRVAPARGDALALNFEEQRLGQNLLQALPPARAAGAQVVRFELSIRYPAQRPGQQPAELLRFHFGFALLVDGRLSYFRIQDHLRRMGLAREAMNLLLAKKPGLEVDDACWATPPAGVAIHPEEHGALLRLFHSVKTIRAAAGGAPIPASPLP